MSQEARWYVVHTYSGYENKVKEDLEKSLENAGLQDIILEVKYPTEETIEILPNGKRKTTTRKVYPGYVMVKMFLTDQSWYVVRNIHGVTGFVGPGSKPVPLSDEEVAALGVEKKQVEVNFEVGDSVKITDGYLDGFIGVVEEIDTDRNMVKVVVSMFGRETPVELQLDQVETIE